MNTGWFRQISYSHICSIMASVTLLTALLGSGCAKDNFWPSVKKYRLGLGAQVLQVWPSNTPSGLYAFVSESGTFYDRNALIERLVVRDDVMIGESKAGTRLLRYASLRSMLTYNSALVFSYSGPIYASDVGEPLPPRQLLIADLSSGAFENITPDNIKDYLPKYGFGHQSWYDEAHGLYLLDDDDSERVILLAGRKKLCVMQKWEAPCSNGKLFMQGRLVNAVLDNSGELFVYSYTTGRMVKTAGYEKLCAQIVQQRLETVKNSNSIGFYLAKNVAVVSAKGQYVILGPDGVRGRMIKGLRNDVPVEEWKRSGVPYKMIDKLKSWAVPFSETQIGVLDAKAKVFYVFE
jgi:hypothetical protein